MIVSKSFLHFIDWPQGELSLYWLFSIDAVRLDTDWSRQSNINVKCKHINVIVLYSYYYFVIFLMAPYHL